MAQILVDEELLIGALMCCLGTKAMLDAMASGVDFPHELVVESAGLIQQVLDATPDDLREQVIQSVLDGVEHPSS